MDTANQWLDNHCHLGPDAEAVLARARSSGVLGFVNVGTDLENSYAAIKVARSHPDVWATAGIHPHEARKGITGLAELLSEEEVVAVGETGLDHHYDHSPRQAQADAFAAHIALANEWEMPIVIHTREAWDETFSLLDAEGVPERTVFHCFTGGPQEAAECIERNAMLSFSGIITFATADDVRAAAARSPLECVMVETDSPYLAPVPHRGSSNQPAYVSLVGVALADAMGLDSGEVALATTTNARRFYGLEAGSDGT
ncbi:MAG: TatD family hydrolase [Acidimicrobiales bacterium]|jgi:TatD DNase family protein|nr:hydrolase TatD [Acidimicrobiaceae bacterium]MDP6077806.1 TatD family hydrolase [Acidimicrobiales bacterium]MDP7258649.1 TatD family hydrolase [Acidimicrobiales bacterium]HJO79058.1 TatD family hydrolase [Acidimicrobiales bacterium]|tara:strand:- start:1074 stop:1844 length:771 start_codon:yes stop_codon:yes gene_type:complete